MATIETTRVVTTSVQLDTDRGFLTLEDIRRFVDECEDERLPSNSIISVGRDGTWIRGEASLQD
ncbi:hypothetical protein SEA_WILLIAMBOONE_102 [Gordonia phage WilliamBoone]|nr:hypothetical protein SEA_WILLIAMBOONE_102 [Gordonia phage WilliamBoone]